MHLQLATLRSSCLQFLACVLVTCLLTQITYGQNQTRQIFERWDKNQDGFLVPTEVPPEQRRNFAANDANKDGKVSLQEHLARARRQQSNTNELQRFYLTQKWHQEPNGYQREVVVSRPKTISKQTPIVVFFHGNGGVAGNAINRFKFLGNVLLIAPQGYESSWNIHGERSEAPDVRFVVQLIDELKRRYPNADHSNVTLIGSSNGSGLLFRLLIELEDKPFRQMIMLVASMVEQQYHDGSFWKPSDHTSKYDTKVSPSKGPKVIYFHGTEDKVVPYFGGLRGGRFRHLSALDSTFHVARAFGYRGQQLTDRQSTEVETGLFKYAYLKDLVTHYKMVGAGHGTGRYGPIVNKIIYDEVHRK